MSYLRFKVRCLFLQGPTAPGGVSDIHFVKSFSDNTVINQPLPELTSGGTDPTTWAIGLNPNHPTQGDNLGLNTDDADMRPTMGPPQDRKPGTVWGLCRTCDWLGVRYFCCSSSQHAYVRSDSAWANPYRISGRDMQR